MGQLLKVNISSSVSALTLHQPNYIDLSATPLVEMELSKAWSTLWGVRIDLSCVNNVAEVDVLRSTHCGESTADAPLSSPPAPLTLVEYRS